MKIFIYYNSCMYVSSANMNIVVLVGSLIVMWFDISSFSKEKCNALYTMSVYIYLSLWRGPQIPRESFLIVIW